MNVGFIGAGKVGGALGRYFAVGGIPVTGYASLSDASARNAAARIGSRVFADVAEAVAASDILFLTVTDNALPCVWDDLRRLQVREGEAGASPLDGKVVCHCSGCLSSTVFEGASQLGARVASAHPLLAVSSPDMPLDELSHATVTLEGDESALEALEALFAPLGNPLRRIEAKDKVAYHAAAVFASNLVLAPLDAAVRLMGACGFDEAAARSALSPLVRGNVERFLEVGAQAALTGPVERSDDATVARHAAALADNPADAYLYGVLSQALISVAAEKHPDRDYAAVYAQALSLASQPPVSRPETKRFSQM